MSEEEQLVAELVALAGAVHERVGRGDPPERWRAVRAEIARLRQQVHELRAKHLGG